MLWPVQLKLKVVANHCAASQQPPLQHMSAAWVSVCVKALCHLLAAQLCNFAHVCSRVYESAHKGFGTDIFMQIALS